ARLCVKGLEVDLLEVGGSQNLRSYWRHYLSHAHVLAALPVHDPWQDHTGRMGLLPASSADPRAAPLLSRCLSPLQDKSDALSTAELREELALHTLSEEREVFLLPTSATWDSLSTATSVLHVKNLLVTLLSQP
ncbi:ADP-ribosylation factor-like protein 10, partial [Antrostomus carolinensis]|uniref:ADP-ribosylation factor-like protein 10 n=1 Tax=Antrostomus carolinensis TaxID=279965 RepID=UPI0010A98B23